MYISAIKKTIFDILPVIDSLTLKQKTKQGRSPLNMLIP